LAAALIDGKALAATIRRDLAKKVKERAAAALPLPGLVTILVGDDPASKVYVARKQREAQQVGMLSESIVLPATKTMPRLLDSIAVVNARNDVHGILVQLPLPAALDAEAAISALDPTKDVDGLHPLNQGALMRGQPGLRPCTPSGCMALLDWITYDLRGRRAVVLGRSTLVGKPLALLMLERDATVTLCHSRTRDLASEIGRADVVVAAVGRPELVRGEWIKPGAVVLDVGVNRVGDRLVGDVEFEAAAARAHYITPVPGGVGPMTVAMLLRNTYEACVARERGRAQ
jgi:methylenetetrahydrofolate dehydrogenase (NADP+) / methenyltetrahydrofolate cyclohydrolase